jgi:hypothetical protein
MRSCLATLLLSTVAATAQAASGPPATPMNGTTAQESVYAANNFSCFSQWGPATFQRAAATASAPKPPALLGLANETLENPSNPKAQQVTMIGLVRLVFSSATAGTLSPDVIGDQITPNLPAEDKFPFSGYSQVWNAGAQTLRVSFTINFKTCAVPVHALFRAAP